MFFETEAASPAIVYRCTHRYCGMAALGRAAQLTDVGGLLSCAARTFVRRAHLQALQTVGRGFCRGFAYRTCSILRIATCPTRIVCRESRKARAAGRTFCCPTRVVEAAVLAKETAALRPSCRIMPRMTSCMRPFH